MKNLIFIACFLTQFSIFAQKTKISSFFLLKEDSIGIEVQRWKDGYDYYEKIIFHQAEHFEEIITIGVDTSAFRDTGYKGNSENGSIPLLDKFNVKKAKSRGNVFYKDSIFCFTATKHDRNTRVQTMFVIQCKRENDGWRINKMIEWPTILSLTVFCNVFFVSEDIVYLHTWAKVWGKDGEEEPDIHCPYMVILGENGTYTKFKQEGISYPPERPHYLPPPSTPPTKH
jgi:hypothetical protein